MTEVFAMVESREIFIVPNFISEGYFCQQVLPRELRLTGPTTERDGRVIHYCDPVGIHPNMTRLLLQRADEVAPDVPRGETSLVIVGHGTNLNENSRKVIEKQVALIRAGGGGFAEVVDAYMEEAPLVSEWHTLTTAPNVIVVPFFIADGLHSYQDIPVLLGFESEVGAAASERDVFRHNPHELHGRRLYYSSAIGTEALMADVILNQVEEFEKARGVGVPSPLAVVPPFVVRVQPLGALESLLEGEDETIPSPESSKGATSADGGIAEALGRWLEEGREVIGQVRITRNEDASFTLRHVDDPTGALAASNESPLLARDIARYDDAGKHRPLKSAPTLPKGWQLQLGSIADVAAALDCLYPAALGMALAEEQGRLRGTPLRDLLGRQTGMYRFANTITDDAALKMIGRFCETKTRCMRRIIWPLSSTQPLSGHAAAKAAKPTASDTIPLLCMEGCCHLIAEARAVAKVEQASGLPVT